MISVISIAGIVTTTTRKVVILFNVQLPEPRKNKTASKGIVVKYPIPNHGICTKGFIIGTADGPIKDYHVYRDGDLTNCWPIHGSVLSAQRGTSPSVGGNQ